jgi:hypothetical protein
MKEEQLKLLLLISDSKGYEAKKNYEICIELVKGGYIDKIDYGLSKGAFVITEKGKELIKALLITANFFETQHLIKQDAKEMMKKAKDKYNTLLDNLKI